MKKTLLFAALLSFAAAPAFAAVKTYQVTGPVVSMTADTITVQKGKENWEIAKGSAAIPADVKVGSRVTIYYSMTAASVEAKPEKAKR
jgi:hypothetical protein